MTTIRNLTLKGTPAWTDAVEVERASATVGEYELLSAIRDTLLDARYLQLANNLSDLADAGTGRTNLGLGTAAVQADSYFLQVANDLSDVADAGTARTNLGIVGNIDWTQASQGTIHATNYVDNNDDTTDHTAFSNIGTNTHAQIDAFIATTDTLHRVFDGVIVETIDIGVIEDIGAVKLTLEALGGGDLTVQFSGAGYTLDATPAAEVVLTAGTDSAPTLNFVYITESGGSLTLVASAVGFPATAHAPVATVMVQTAASLAIDGAFKVHAWTDHINSSTENGHLSHINAKLRVLQATWISGTDPGDMVVSSPDAYLSTASGVVFQLHNHTMPARDMQTGDPLWVVNDPTTAFKRITTLDDITQDASGGVINNKYLNLVLWGVVSEDEADCKLFVNLPTDTYNSESAAQSDSSSYAVYSMPIEYTGTAFLIGRYTVQAKDSGAWVQSQKVDLRGLLPSTSPGGGPVGDHLQLTNIGANTHAQIDTHLALTNQHIDWTASDAGTIDPTNYSGPTLTINVQTGTTYTVLASDNGKVITLDNASAITLDMTAALQDGFNCVIIQKGAGQVTVSAGGETVLSAGSLLSLTGQGSSAALTVIAAGVWHLAGDLA